MSPQPLFTVLLDDCHHTFGRSERQPIVSLLNSGSDLGGVFPAGEEDYLFFGPKAFASNAPLPRSLAARCIPIVLRRPKPSEKFARLQYPELYDTAGPLGRALREWTENIHSALRNAAKSDPANLPPGLSPGQRRCAEPLLNIADVAGGQWPAKARAALTAVFDLAEASPQLQLLHDLRSIFRLKNSPEYLATRDLLSELRNMEDRPWSAWSSNSGRRIAFHLRPFGIGPRVQSHGSDRDSRGYFQDDFQDAWERYLPFVSVEGSNGSCDGSGACDGSKLPSAASSVAQIPATGAD